MKARVSTKLDKLNKRPYDNGNILELKLLGWTYEAIGKYYGKTKPTIWGRLKPFRDLVDQDGLAEADSQRVGLLKAAQFKVLTELVRKGKLEKASVNNLAYAHTQLHNSERLEAGKSTGNFNLHHIIETIEREERQAPKPDHHLDAARLPAIEAGEDTGENGR